MQITLNEDQLDSVTKQLIKDLKSQVAKLGQKNKQLETKLNKERVFNKFAKQYRDAVIRDAEQLVETLRCVGWIEYDRYYGD